MSLEWWRPLHGWKSSALWDSCYTQTRSLQIFVSSSQSSRRQQTSALSSGPTPKVGQTEQTVRSRGRRGSCTSRAPRGSELDTSLRGAGRDRATPNRWRRDLAHAHSREGAARNLPALQTDCQKVLPRKPLPVFRYEVFPQLAPDFLLFNREKGSEVQVSFMSPSREIPALNFLTKPHK